VSLDLQCFEGMPGRAKLRSLPIRLTIEAAPGTTSGVAATPWTARRWPGPDPFSAGQRSVSNRRSRIYEEAAERRFRTVSILRAHARVALDESELVSGKRSGRMGDQECRAATREEAVRDQEAEDEPWCRAVLQRHRRAGGRGPDGVGDLPLRADEILLAVSPFVDVEVAAEVTGEPQRDAARER